MKFFKICLIRKIFLIIKAMCNFNSEFDSDEGSRVCFMLRSVNANTHTRSRSCSIQRGANCVAVIMNTFIDSL